MYTTEVTGHYRFVRNGLPPPCACQRCVHFDYSGHNHHGGGGGGGGGVQTSRQADHPVLDQGRRDGPELWAKEPARTLGNGRLDRSCHRSPQRRPVFVGTIPCNRMSPVCSYEIPSVHCNCNARHCPPLREQCGCVHNNHSRGSNIGIPHQLPHLQVKGQGYKPCKTVRYASMEDEDYVSDRSSFEPQYSPQMGFVPNGHCGTGTFAPEEREGRDTHQEWDRTQPERSEHGCNGHGGFYKGFFSTEVPPKRFNPTRRKNGPCLSATGGTMQGAKSNGAMAKREQSPEPSELRGKDSVREQIRQVVTNLEDVLGGLKQVHVEMREVVEQIDRLTADIDLSQETPGIARGPESDRNGLDLSDGSRAAVPIGNRQPRTARRVDEEQRVILRTNSPSPVHTASVVKTNRVVPPAKRNGLKNGHPPQLSNSNHTGRTISAQGSPRPQALDPKVIIETRTQKPPPYPQQNGRCGKYQAPVKPPSHLGRGRQSSSVV